MWRQRLREKGVRYMDRREQTTIRLPAKLMEQLRKEADRRGVSFNDYLLWLIIQARQTESG